MLVVFGRRTDFIESVFRRSRTGWPTLVVLTRGPRPVAPARSSAHTATVQLPPSRIKSAGGRSLELTHHLSSC